MVRKYNFIAIVHLVFAFSIVQVRAQEILDNYLVVAAENNPKLKSRFNEYLAALEKTPQVRTLPDPQVMFGYLIMPIETRVGPQRFRISASQMFPWFGTLKTKESYVAQEAKIKYEQFEEAKSELFNDVRAAYYNFYFNRKAIAILEENIQILNALKRLALIKVEAGTVSPVDEYRIEMEIGDLNNQLALLNDQRRYLGVSFENLLNTELDSIELPEILWEVEPALSKKGIRDSMMVNNPQIISLELQQEALRIQQEVARKEGSPDLSIGLDYIVVGKGENNMSGKDAFIFPIIGITIPLYRSKYEAMIREAAYLETAREQEKVDKMNMLETLFENTWKEYADADRRLGLYSEQIVLAEKSIQLLESEYLTDNSNFDEVLRMERKQLFYALELERARTDKQAAVSFMKYLMGS